MVEDTREVHQGIGDPTLEARIVGCRPLSYVEGPSVEMDRPAHVRAGSALAFTGNRLLVVQDDALFLGVVDLIRGEVRAQAMPRGQGGARLFDERRGNKKDKLDLEACVWFERGLEPFLMAFGSGSRRERQRIALVRWRDAAEADVDLVDADTLYDHLRAETAFSGAELNIEGAALVGEDTLRLFQRGNGQRRGELLPVDATGDLSVAELLEYLRAPSERIPPRLKNVRQYALGALDGVRLTFTDATASPDGQIVFTAAAEASPDVYSDGEVRGSVIGVIGPDGAARWAPLRDADGTLVAIKAEGIALDPSRPGRAWIVLDMDDTERPCELCEVQFGPSTS